MKPSFWTLLCLTGFASLINPAVAHAQNYRNCAWPLLASPLGSANVVLPESVERFRWMTFDTSSQTMTIKGTYPDARFLSFVVYNGKSPVDIAGHLYDAEIAPDPGSGVNPFVQSGPKGSYTITLSRTAGKSSGNVIKVGADFAWIAMRVYVPSADPGEGGKGLSGKVPLPTVYLVNHQLDECDPVQKLADVRALYDALFPTGFDLIGGEGTPSTDRLWFAAPEKVPARFFPNPDNKYLMMMPGDHYQPGRIIVVHAKAPGTPFTYDGSPIWKPARGFQTVDVRYWSLCNNDFALPVGLVQCTGDLTAEREGGDYTVVISDDLQRPDWLRPDTNWLPYGDEQYPKLFLFRNMLPSPDFHFAVQDTLTVPKCTFKLNLPHIPTREQIDEAGRCAQSVMKDYYPVAVWCDVSKYRSGGWQACIKED